VRCAIDDCCRLTELLDAEDRGLSEQPEKRDSPQTAQTQDQVGPLHPIRRSALSVHSRRGAGNPPCHHAAVQTLDYSQGLAD
jgi:hypothetical protein